MSENDVVHTETQYFLNTLYLSLVIFAFFIMFYELNRNMQTLGPIYQKRSTRFMESNRIPPSPSKIPFSWIISIMRVKEDDVFRMVGLDGYMLIRYINVCFKMSMFFTFWGMLVLLPIYSNAGGEQLKWNRYTLANVPFNPSAKQLWAPAIFAYVFSVYFCHLMYTEYSNFVEKRIEYLVKGDLDTPPQTHYTVIAEKVPSNLRSAPALRNYFENIFPSNVYSVEIALDLTELNAMTMERRQIRDELEKSIAITKALNKRPLKWVKKDYYKDAESMPEMFDNSIAAWFGYIVIDKIQHLELVLSVLNERVRILQIATFRKRQKVEEKETKRQQNVRGKIEAHVTKKVSRVFIKGLDSLYRIQTNALGPMNNNDTGDLEIAHERSQDNEKGEFEGRNNYINFRNAKDMSNREYTHSDFSFCWKQEEELKEDEEFLDKGHGHGNGSQDININVPNFDDYRIKTELEPKSKINSTGSEPDSENTTIMQTAPFLDGMLPSTGNITETNHHQHNSCLQSSLKSSLRSEQQSNHNRKTSFGNSKAILLSFMQESCTTISDFAGDFYRFIKNVVHQLLEGIRAIELLTVGAYYKTSSTAFVTFNSRVSKTIAHQSFLSHVNYTMDVKPAPNPKDCIWNNICIPLKQIEYRTKIADLTLCIGAVFWSIVVGFITATASSGSASLSKEYPWIQNNTLYVFLNKFFALGLLLLLLSTLPVIFDFIARSYEGRKLESEIQNSIMTRYFYYQLANVFVSVGLGSIANSIQDIIQNPSAILSILGKSLPSLSLYFTNLLIIKSFIAVPIELLRLWPLVRILTVRLFSDKKTLTTREQQNGVNSDPKILYGWIYPNLLMVLMIISTYCCIAPLLVPFGVVYYAFVYLMYKYQLLYVYINNCESGGYMWYAVFNRSMMALIAGVITLWGYLGIRLTFYSGPFYLLAPLPFCITFFWYKCEERFKVASMALSLENAIELDKETTERTAVGLSIPQDTFRSDLFRQPSLAEGMIVPQQQQIYNQGQNDPHYHIIKGSKVLNDAGRIIATFKKGGSISWGEAKEESDLDKKECICDDTTSSIAEEEYKSEYKAEYVDDSTSHFNEIRSPLKNELNGAEDLLNNDFIPFTLYPYNSTEEFLNHNPSHTIQVDKFEHNEPYSEEKNENASEI